MAQKRPLTSYAGTLSEVKSGDFMPPDLIPSAGFHGIETAGSLVWNQVAGARTLTLVGPVAYWYKGTRFYSATDVVCDLLAYYPGGLTTNNLYFVAFEDATGTLKASQVMNLKEKCPVCMVFWNGSIAAVTLEKHGHTRNLDWHINAHRTIGTRYWTGLSLTAPTGAGNQSSINVGDGILYDEDISLTLTNAGMLDLSRVFHRVGVDAFTFLNSTLPYAGSLNTPQYLDTDTYLLANVGAAKYACYWVYGTGDIDRPIYIYPSHVADSYNTPAAARAEATPIISGVVATSLNPEMKLLYRFIYKGDGTYIETVDYRLSSPLPAGGVAPTTAIGVSVTAIAGLDSSNVQGALEELQLEKAPALGTDDNYVTDAEKVIIGNTSGTNTGDQTDATLSFSDIATNDVSTTKHGFFPKLPTPAGKFLRDDMSWQTAGGGGVTLAADAATNASYYPVWATATTGAISTLYTTASKMSFNPSTGTLTCTNFYSSSDEDLKTNIEGVTGDVIAKLRGVEFDWKDTGQHSSGLIAQELEKVIPFLVQEVDGIKVVNYDGLIPYLIESIKSLQQRIDILEGK